MANSPTGESVLERMDRILAAFTAEHSRLTGGQLAVLAGLPPATAHRLARDMARQGWLERVEGGRYVVGTRLWELANRASRELTLARTARPFMGDIHAVLRQHVQLGIMEGREVLLLERLSHPGAVPVRASVAGRLPLHLSATGLVLLAHAPGEVQQAYLEGPLAAFTPLSPTDPHEVAAELERIRARGHAVQTGYLEPETTGIAVPVRGRGEQVLAGLGVITPAGDPGGRAPAIVQALHTAAHGIRRTLRETGRDRQA
ncbi:IclR family transcriptional regulator [Kocuria flava]|uniref:IclR family transcriptional regulator n=1 Tax=Kocuria flava TaxID=446860 RepID=UPI001C5E09A4|nr:IclR family transcriptional regulator [Kocuria flava]